MITMAVGDYDRVEPLEVETKLLDVMFEEFSVVACVKQNPLAAVLYERGKAPVFHQCGRRSECVVQDRDSLGLLRIRRSRKRQESRNGNRKTTSASIHGSVSLCAGINRQVVV